MVILAGDFNARVGRHTNENELSVIGRHPYMSHSEDEHNEHIWENRLLLLEFCLLRNLVIANTRFEQPDDNKVTYRLPGTQPTASVHERGFEQIDYVTINKEFQNAIKT